MIPFRDLLALFFQGCLFLAYLSVKRRGNGQVCPESAPQKTPGFLPRVPISLLPSLVEELGYRSSPAPGAGQLRVN